MGSKTKVVDTTPQATQVARQKLQDMLFNQTTSQGPPQTVGFGGMKLSLPGKNGTTPNTSFQAHGIPGATGAPSVVPGFMATAPDAPTSTNILATGPVSTKFNSGEDISRGQVRDVAAGNTDSVDKLGGANSAFFQNMMSQLAPAFTQERSEGLAAAKESSGTLTGSGFANRLGASINRSLGNEQAALANYASQGLQTEVQRQQGDAARQLSAATANQGADQTFINQILQRNNQGLQAQQLGLTAETQNQNTAQQTNLTQAQLDQQRKLAQYQMQGGINQQNAQVYAQLLGQQAGLGVGPTTVQQSGGIGSFLGGVAGTALGAFAGPVGAAAGGKLGSKLFG